MVPSTFLPPLAPATLRAFRVLVVGIGMLIGIVIVPVLVVEPSDPVPVLVAWLPTTIVPVMKVCRSPWKQTHQQYQASHPLLPHE